MGQTASQHVLSPASPASAIVGVSSVDTSNDEAMRRQVDERIVRSRKRSKRCSSDVEDSRLSTARDLAREANAGTLPCSPDD